MIEMHVKDMELCPFCGCKLIRFKNKEETREGWDKEAFFHPTNECILKDLWIPPYMYKKWNTRVNKTPKT